MYSQILVVLFFCCKEVLSNDIKLGCVSPNARKLYGKVRHAISSPWLRTDYINVQAPKGEVISGIVVTDLSDDRDGNAFIESGGIGMKKVTIGLKSTRFLTGFRFRVEVFTNGSPFDSSTANVKPKKHYINLKREYKYA